MSKTFCRACGTTHEGLYLICPSCGMKCSGDYGEHLPSKFDQQLPVYVESLHKALQNISGKASGLWQSDHECNCEYCDETDDGYMPEDKKQEYNELRDEAIEAANTLRRCIRYAQFRKIELKKPAKDYNFNWMIPAAIE